MTGFAAILASQFEGFQFFEMDPGVVFDIVQQGTCYYVGSFQFLRQFSRSEFYPFFKRVYVFEIALHLPSIKLEK